MPQKNCTVLEACTCNYKKILLVPTSLYLFQQMLSKYYHINNSKDKRNREYRGNEWNSVDVGQLKLGTYVMSTNKKHQ